MCNERRSPRFFKTKTFTKLAAKARIPNAELFRASLDLAQGKGDNLGGHVWKKRLSKNLYRSIVIEKTADWWFFVYLYAKQDRENIALIRLRKPPSSCWQISMRC